MSRLARRPFRKENEDMLIVMKVNTFVYTLNSSSIVTNVTLTLTLLLTLTGKGQGSARRADEAETDLMETRGRACAWRHPPRAE